MCERMARLEGLLLQVVAHGVDQERGSAAVSDVVEKVKRDSHVPLAKGTLLGLKASPSARSTSLAAQHADCQASTTEQADRRATMH